MVTAEGPKVLEYNCRFGDPETQVILTRLEGDLLPLLQGVIDGHLRDVHPRWAHHASCCVVMAARGYPNKVETGHVITGLDEAAGVEGVTVFHAATRDQDGSVVTQGGRVLGVTAISPSLAAARERAYEAVGRIRFEGSHHRTDIGADVLEFLRSGR